jgi:nicotinamide-nucleotide amidase
VITGGPMGTVPGMSDNNDVRQWETDAAEVAGRIAELLQDSGQTAAAAESLTGGAIASRLSAASGASTWLKGGVVAYAADVKFSVLGVTPGPVITAPCAREMATGAARVLGADFAVATTGAGGPGEEEGQPAGTVFIAVAGPADCQVREYHFQGDPEPIVAQTARQALLDLETAVKPGARD